MGILLEPLEFIAELIDDKKLKPGFAVCELGDQYITHGERRLARAWYEDARCGLYESIDGNGRGTITANLNRPLPKKLRGFDLVTDFGTGEHIFDQAQVWATVHYLTRPGGYIVFDRPTAGYPGHCYYLIQRALVMDLAAANEYTVIKLEEATTTRGELLRGVMQRSTEHKRKFVVPQMGRYKKLLRPIT